MIYLDFAIQTVNQNKGTGYDALYGNVNAAETKVRNFIENLSNHIASFDVANIVEISFTASDVVVDFSGGGGSVSFATRFLNSPWGIYQYLSTLPGAPTYSAITWQAADPGATRFYGYVSGIRMFETGSAYYKVFLSDTDQTTYAATSLVNAQALCLEILSGLRFSMDNVI